MAMNRVYSLKPFNWIGRILMLLGLAFIIKQLWVVRIDLVQGLNGIIVWPIVLFFSILYGLSELLLPLGWLNLLRAQGLSRSAIIWEDAWRLYGKSQIAKYVPGNFFHIAGRHLMAKEKGLKHEALAVAAILEIILLIAAALLLSLSALGKIAGTTGLPFFFIPAVIASGSLLIVIVTRLGGDWPIRKKLYVNGPRLIAAQLSYALFSIISCLLFLAVLCLITDDGYIVLQQWPLIFGGYCFAWVAGFIVPGAPGGLGIREAMLLALLDTTLPGPGLLLGILVFRIINTLGDLLFYAVAFSTDNDTDNV